MSGWVMLKWRRLFFRSGDNHIDKTGVRPPARAWNFRETDDRGQRDLGIGRDYREVAKTGLDKTSGPTRSKAV